MGGSEKPVDSLVKICKNKLLNDDVGEQLSWDSVLLNLDAPMSPCGTYASMMPTDNFVLYKKSPEDTAPTSETTKDKNIPIVQTSLVWSSQKGNRFKRVPDSESKQWVDPESGIFVVDGREVYGMDENSDERNF